MMYPDKQSVGVLIHGTGMPNENNLSVSVISNHGGVPINEIILIYAVERETMSAIYYRAISGNIVDIATLKSTINELKNMNVNIVYSVLDAGCDSESNLEELYSLGIDFMTRLISNRGLYMDLLTKNCDLVIRPTNRIVYNKRQLLMAMNKVNTPNNRKA
jgi:hypothetical protein